MVSTKVPEISEEAINLSRDINPNTPKFLKIPKIRKLFPYGKFIESRTIDEIPNPYDGTIFVGK